MLVVGKVNAVLAHHWGVIAHGKFMRLALGVVLMLLVSWPALTWADAPSIKLYYYHNKPPYINDPAKETGSYFDFVRYLNAHQVAFHFTLVSIPRIRVERALEQQSLDGALLGVNPNWFNDKAEVNYLWTPAVFTDEDIFIALREQSFQYTGIDSLLGRVICVVLGNYYQGVNEAAHSGDVHLLTTSRETAIFDMLDKKRCEVGIVSRSLFDHYASVNHWQDKYQVSIQPHDAFERRILVPKTLNAVYLTLSQVIPQWRALPATQ